VPRIFLRLQPGRLRAAFHDQCHGLVGQPLARDVGVAINAAKNRAAGDGRAVEPGAQRAHRAGERMRAERQPDLSPAMRSSSPRTIDELVDPDAIISTPLPLETTGAQALKEVFGRLHTAYPDLHVAIVDLIAEGDKVVSRNSASGTHLGEYMGLQPTGKSVTYNEIFIFRFVNGRIAETWGVVDVFSQLRQLGAWLA
jgi:predicted ester cyclase